MDYRTSLSVYDYDNDKDFKVNTILDLKGHEKDYKLFRILIDIWNECRELSPRDIFPESFNPKEWEEYLKKINSTHNEEFFIFNWTLDKLKNFDWNKKIDYAIDGEKDLIGKTYAEAAGDFYDKFLPQLEAETIKYNNASISFTLRVIIREGKTTIIKPDGTTIIK